MIEVAMSLVAFVTESEGRIVEAALRHITRALTLAGNAMLASFDQGLAAAFGDLAAAPQDAILVTSLIADPLNLEQSWAEVESRLRSGYSDLCASGKMVFICTTFRHVGTDGDPESLAKLRVRIRRLNLLAADISRESGALVCDFDRALANVGARKLDTDYRLGGAAAAELASHALATDVIVNALDGKVSFEVQDKARAIVAELQSLGAASSDVKPRDVIMVGQGRRKQAAATIADANQDNHVGNLIRQALNGQIGARAAYVKISQAVSRRGLKASVAMLAGGFYRNIIKRG